MCNQLQNIAEFNCEYYWTVNAVSLSTYILFFHAQALKTNLTSVWNVNF